MLTDIVQTPPDEQAQVVAAKLHVLRLGPIKAKMGERWERLASLVHKLFEKTLRQVQGPQDHFLRLDDMSYVVSFHQLSVEEASLACAAIAKEVCELLFGADVEDISVRSLVGPVSPKLFETGAAAGANISQYLERKGGEIIVSHPPGPSPAWRAMDNHIPMGRDGWTPGRWIARAHDMATQFGWNFGFFPVWNLHKRTSFSLFATLCSGTAQRSQSAVRRALAALDEAGIVEAEIALLFAAAECAHRLQAARRVCVLGVGASYETLSGFHSRIRYIGALNAIRTVAECPLMVRLGPIPDGTPLGRIAEIVAMMSLPNVRVSLAFKTPRTLPEMDIRLGAAGIGGILAADTNPAAAALIAQRLARRGADQKCFTFLHGLDSLALLGAARDNGIQAGSGHALGGGQYFTGQEAVPEFPLQADAVSLV